MSHINASDIANAVHLFRRLSRLLMLHDTHYTTQNHNHYISQRIQRKKKTAVCTAYRRYGHLECIRSALTIGCWPLADMDWTSSILSTVILSYSLCWFVFMHVFSLSSPLYEFRSTSYTNICMPQNDSLYIHCSLFNNVQILNANRKTLFAFFDRWYFTHSVNVSFGFFFLLVFRCLFLIS